MIEKRTEIEVFGVNYERFSLGRQLQRFVKEYDIKTVCELPAHGAKAAPSLYSLDFALAGVKVTLVNGVEESLKFYKELGIEENVEIIKVDSISNTGLENNKFDFVWNFAFIPTYKNKSALLDEMRRISRKHVAVFSVNKRNAGFPLHRFAHWRTKIPWTHGDIKFNSPSYLKNFFKISGLKNIKTGVVDCPVWPDSVGFRDIRLHKNNITFDNVDWIVPYIDYLKNNKYPSWFKYVYFVERLPIPLFMKYIYAHIFFVTGIVVEN